MDQVFNVGDTILLDGEPLALVTQAGVEAWIENGVPHSYRYDQVRDPLSGKMKYRCLYEKAGADVPFVLVNDPKNGDGRVILFDSRPAQVQQMLGPDNAIWDDGEWVSWHEINQQLQYKEWGAKYPNADRALIPIFEDLLSLAEAYHLQTGLHLQVYGDIGELFAAITHGVKLHRNYAQGSDGRLGNDFIEVKTITPFKARDFVTISSAGNFSKLFVVKINEDFEIAGRMVDRGSLRWSGKPEIKVHWDDLEPGT